MPALLRYELLCVGRALACGKRGVPKLLRSHNVCLRPRWMLCSTGPLRVHTPRDTDTEEEHVEDRGEKPVDKRTAPAAIEKRHAFVKGIFVGEFDKHALIYPEMEIEEVQELESMVAPIEKYFTEKLDSKSIDINAKIPDEVLKQIKELGLFGQQIPVEFGGLGLNATQYARIAEVTSLDGAIAVTLAAHQAIGLKGILLVGTDEQKKKYLPKLATGEYTAAFCLTEPSSGSDAASIQTRATLSEDGRHWLLSGEKIWISNGGIADVFTVFARTSYMDDQGRAQDKVSAFLVERAFGGVSSGRPEDKLGIRGSNTCAVSFDNTPVPVENVLGEIGQGFKLAMTILNGGRFSMGSSGAGMIKRMIGWVMEHAANRKQFGKNLVEFGMIQEKFAHLAMTAYAMESMAYLTSGMLDSGAYDDCSVEAAIVKVYSSEGSWRAVSECLQMLGGLGYMKDYPYERYLRDSRIMLIFEGTNEILRLFIALNGLQYAGQYYKELMDDMKNVWTNPRAVQHYAKAFIRRTARHKLRAIAPGAMAFRQHSMMSPHQLEKDVHPQLANSAKMLSSTVENFSHTTQMLLKKFRADVVNEQMLLARLADVSISIFAMTAVIARASRSKCIGLTNCDHEVLLAKTFTYQTHMDTMKTLEDIDLGLHGDTIYKSYSKIAKELHENMGYIAEHPLKRNW